MELEQRTSERFVVGEPDASGTNLTIREAAERAGVSVSTYRRYLLTGKVAGAHKGAGPDGIEWRIPVVSVEPLVREPRGPKTASGKRWQEEKKELEAALKEKEEALAIEKAEHTKTRDDLIEALKGLPRGVGPVPTGPVEKVEPVGVSKEITEVVEAFPALVAEAVAAALAQQGKRRGWFGRK